MGRGVIIGLAALLFVSLAVNIFALGHVSGRMIAGQPPQHHDVKHGPRGGFEDPFKIMRYAEELSPELRERFRGAFREQLPVMRQSHREMGGLRRELGELMSAEDWDEAAILAKLDEIDAVQESQRDAFNKAFMSAFESLPADERKRLIDTANERRAERRKRWKERRDDRRGPPPGDENAPPPPPED
ncbi:periplasmic heavy metal sensor [Hyphococcus sp.]|uniref:periplasmic heavy metal sensor n=1 Tax=Hyphococcus sp. TaxID=2038636 RepID=UPI0035C73F9C